MQQTPKGASASLIHSLNKTMEARVGIEHAGKVDEIDDIDFDIDFAVNELGRPMTLGKYGNADDISFNDMELVDSQTYRDPKEVAGVGNGSAISIASVADTVESSTTDLSSIVQKSRAIPSRDDVSNSSVPLPEQVQRQRSAPRPIPVASKVISTNHPTQGSQPSSAGSTGSAFLNNILNPASAFNNGHLSHTPPTHVSTSYEASHFGKRARSGVSILSLSRLSSFLIIMSHLHLLPVTIEHF